MDAKNGQLDVQRLIGAVAERHGILLKPDDAAFALVTMNQLALEEAMKAMANEMADAVVEFEKAAERVQMKVGSHLANEVREVTAAIRRELNADVAAPGIQAHQLVSQIGKPYSRAVLARWLCLGVACGLFLFLCGFLIGKMVQ